MLQTYDEELVSVFEAALRSAFSSLREKNKEKFYYYAFLFDSGLYPYSSGWSYEALERSIAENKLSEKDRAWWKWNCNDSPYAVYGYDLFFGEVKKLLAARGKGLSVDILFGDEWRIRLSSMEEAMKRLDQAGFFGVGDERKKVVINVETVPPDGSEYNRALRLNPSSPLLSDYLQYCEPPQCD